MTNRNQSKPSYRVYVIELHADVLGFGRFADANPDYVYDPERPPLYVGHSVRNPEKRFEQHQNGVKASRYTRGWSIRLRMDLVGNLEFPTRGEAEQMEAEHAAMLRAHGFAVWQN